MKVFHIRQATIEDAEVVYSIVKAAFGEYEGVTTPSPSALRDTLESTQRDVAEGRTVLLYVSEPDDSPLTGSFVEWVDSVHIAAQPAGTVRYEPKDDHLYVGRLAVMPAYRGKGVGRALMLHMEELAPKLGLTCIRLNTRQSMPTNLAFYQSLAYKIVERDEESRVPDVIVGFE